MENGDVMQYVATKAQGLKNYKLKHLNIFRSMSDFSDVSNYYFISISFRICVFPDDDNLAK